ncbi:MAG: immunoglobulin-like domain-containing protein [Ruminococcus sp.]
MKKYLFIALLCFIMTVTCLLSAFGSVIHINENKSAFSTTPTEIVTIENPTYKIDSKEPLTLSVGESKVIAISKDEEKTLRKWTSSDVNIATIDSGGRVDAKKEGNVTVTALFSDNKKYECKVTVVKAEKEEVDRFSTCITANSDVLKKNLSYNSGRNPYSIYVNRKQNCVTVYTYDENGDYTVPIRAMVCSCGKNDGTITGTYGIYFKSEWHSLFDNVYGQYVSGISGDYLFHSVPYYTKSSDDLEVEEFNKLGSNASLGCVRLSVSDTKWIYDNCANNTEVKIYDDDNPGPLGKPETIKITDLKCGWDPTDDNKSNPYYNKTPIITGAENYEIKKGGSFSPMDKIKAVDTCSNDITDKIVVTGNVVTSRVGKYKVTYSVTDSLHRSTSVDITVTVKN